MSELLDLLDNLSDWRLWWFAIGLAALAALTGLSIDVKRAKHLLRNAYGGEPLKRKLIVIPWATFAVAVLVTFVVVSLKEPDDRSAGAMLWDVTWRGALTALLSNILGATIFSLSIVRLVLVYLLGNWLRYGIAICGSLEDFVHGALHNYAEVTGSVVSGLLSAVLVFASTLIPVLMGRGIAEMLCSRR